MTPIGIVIPARNEEQHIGVCLSSLSGFREQGAEIVVVNAQSEDKTLAIVQGFGVDTLNALEPNRGKAVAQGVHYLQRHHPECGYLIIAHADMRFLSDSHERFHQAITCYPDTVWGAFGHRIQAAGMVYRLLEKGNACRAKALRFPFGDQVQFFRMDVLQEVGFPDQLRLEDVELCYRFNKKERYLYLHQPVWIPNRHWKNGWLKTTFQNWITLYRYHKNRNHPDYSYNPST